MSGNSTRFWCRAQSNYCASLEHAGMSVTFVRIAGIKAEKHRRNVPHLTCSPCHERTLGAVSSGWPEGAAGRGGRRAREAAGGASQSQVHAAQLHVGFRQDTRHAALLCCHQNGPNQGAPCSPFAAPADPPPPPGGTYCCPSLLTSLSPVPSVYLQLSRDGGDLSRKSVAFSAHPQ